MIEPTKRKLTLTFMALFVVSSMLMLVLIYSILHFRLIELDTEDFKTQLGTTTPSFKQLKSFNRIKFGLQ